MTMLFESPFTSALLCRCLALPCNFSSESCVDWSTCTMTSCTNDQWAYLEFLSCNFSNIQLSTNEHLLLLVG